MATYLPRRSLSIDFAKDGQASGDNYPDELSKLDSLIAFSRASVATRFNASGAIETVAAGQPRFDYDPVTLTPRGLLIEAQRTNLLLNSSALSTQSVAVTAQAYTLSFYGTGTVTRSGASSGALAGTGALVRVSVTFTPSAGTQTFTVSGSVLNAQLEAGSFATSYIPTAGSAVTRAAESAYIGTLAPWFGTSAGTILIDSESGLVTASGGAGGKYYRELVITSVFGSLNPNSFFFTNDGQQDVYVRASNIDQFTSAQAANAIGRNRIAFSYQAGAFSYCVNGGTVQSGASGSVPSGLVYLDLAQEPATRWVRRLSVQPYKISDLLLKQMTLV